MWDTPVWSFFVLIPAVILGFTCGVGSIVFYVLVLWAVYRLCRSRFLVWSRNQQVPRADVSRKDYEPKHWCSWIAGDGLSEWSCMRRGPDKPTVAFWGPWGEYNIVTSDRTLTAALIKDRDRFVNDGREVGSLFPQYMIGHWGPRWTHVKYRLKAAMFGMKTQESVLVEAVSKNIHYLFESLTSPFTEKQLFGAAQAMLLRIFLYVGCGLDVAEPQRVRLTQSYVELEECLREPSILPFWLPTARTRRVRRASGVIQQFFRSLLSEPRYMSSGGAFLQSLIDDIQQGRLTLDEAVDNAAGFALAGEDARTLATLLSDLAEHPKLQDELHLELKEWSLDREALQGLKRVPLVLWTLKEVQRTDATIPIFTRRTLCDLTLDNLFLPAGSRLHVDTTRLDDDPEFDPKRWEKPRRDIPFLAFGSGHRKCMGESYAMLQLQLILAALVQKWRWETDSEGRLVTERRAS